MFRNVKFVPGDNKQNHAVQDSSGNVYSFHYTQIGYVFIKDQNKTYRPLMLDRNNKGFFLQFSDDRFSAFMVTYSLNQLQASNCIYLVEVNSLNINDKNTTGRYDVENPDCIPYLYLNSSPKYSEVLFSLEALKKTIFWHPFRTVAGLGLTAFFLGLLCINPLLLPNFLSFLAYPLQTFALSLGGVVPVAIVGSLLTLTAPKWVGNVLQFVGDKIIGGFINGLLQLTYIIFFLLPVWLKIIKPKAPGVFIDFKFDEDVTIGYLWWIPLTLIRIPMYLTHWIGKGLDRLGMLIAGEFHIAEQQPNYQVYNKSVSTQSSTQIVAMLTEIHDTLATMPTQVDKWISSKILFPNNSRLVSEDDPAFVCPEAREWIVTQYVDLMGWLDNLPSFRKQLENSEKADISEDQLYRKIS